MTTVGYGDFAPRTDIGELFTVLYMIGGIGVMVGFVMRVAYHSRREIPKATTAKP